jgi:hypothetical protein
MSEQRGSAWDVPSMPRDQWQKWGAEVWADVEDALHEGWHFKLKDAYRLAHGHEPTEQRGWLTPEAAVKADDLGAPVGQMFMVCALRRITP